MDSKFKLNLSPHLIFLIIENNVKYSFNLPILKSFIRSFRLHFFHTRFTYSIESLIKRSKYCCRFANRSAFNSTTANLFPTFR